MFNARRVALLDSTRLVNQLCALQPRTSSGGRSIVDHSRNGADDLANACAGVIATLITNAPLKIVQPYIPSRPREHLSDFSNAPWNAQPPGGNCMMTEPTLSTLGETLASLANDLGRVLINRDW